MHIIKTLLAVLTLSLSSFSYSYTDFYEVTLFDNVDKLDDNKGWYIGSLFGNGKYNYNGGSDDAFASGGYWGVNFIEALGLESSIVSTNDDTNGVKHSFLAFTITPKINIQFHRRFSLYLKGGLSLSHQTADFGGDDIPSWSGSIPTYGLGGEFRIVAGLEARLSYDKMKGKLAFNETSSDSTYTDSEIDLDLITLGIQYQF